MSRFQAEAIVPETMDTADSYDDFYNDAQDAIDEYYEERAAIRRDEER